MKLLEDLQADNNLLREQVKHLEAIIRRLEKPKVDSALEMRVQQLTAIINYTISEFGSSFAGQYLKGVMDNLSVEAQNPTK
jgi:uncharacterized protein YutE (UPF0331/DUF86 family)